MGRCAAAHQSTAIHVSLPTLVLVHAGGRSLPQTVAVVAAAPADMIVAVQSSHWYAKYQHVSSKCQMLVTCVIVIVRVNDIIHLSLNLNKFARLLKISQGT